ncbi:hypothetical protein QAD02_010641 [Eretmocerus hayati]|uniref:Uncharacterized protein n=1 Tax=Eretmocerus hayati TaxID=131215 RepID=A0ACC2NUJ5_9HYME|nr:hypothetical protein QAD02_010641 [Eretmocerus hayati]
MAADICQAGTGHPGVEYRFTPVQWTIILEAVLPQASCSSWAHWAQPDQGSPGSQRVAARETGERHGRSPFARLLSSWLSLFLWTVVQKTMRHEHAVVPMLAFQEKLHIQRKAPCIHSMLDSIDH